jgi:hypothetical protein
LERIGEDDSDEEAFLQDLWEEGGSPSVQATPFSAVDPGILGRGCVRSGLPEKRELRLETCIDSRNLVRDSIKGTRRK